MPAACKSAPCWMWVVLASLHFYFPKLLLPAKWHPFHPDRSGAVSTDVSASKLCHSFPSLPVAVGMKPFDNKHQSSPASQVQIWLRWRLILQGQHIIDIGIGGVSDQHPAIQNGKLGELSIQYAYTGRMNLLAKTTHLCNPMRWMPAPAPYHSSQIPRYTPCIVSLFSRAKDRLVFTGLSDRA